MISVSHARPSSSDGASDLVVVSSDVFGGYTVPLHQLTSITAADIIARVTRVANGVVVAQPVAHNKFVLVSAIDADDAVVVNRLHCAARLRADLPVMTRQHVASAIIRHWMYLVWMHLIGQDAAPLTLEQRDRALWSMIRQLEWSHTTYPQPRHKGNRAAVSNVKRGMLLTSLLLTDEKLLNQLVVARGITPNALLTLPEHQLHVENLRHLLGQINQPGVSRRITRGNIQQLLLPRPSTTKQSEATESKMEVEVVEEEEKTPSMPPPTIVEQSPAPPPSIAQQPPSADDGLRALVQASDATFVSSAKTRVFQITAALARAWTSQTAATSDSTAQVEQHATSHSLASPPDEQSHSPSQSTTSSPPSSSFHSPSPSSPADSTSTSPLSITIQQAHGSDDDRDGKAERGGGGVDDEEAEMEEDDLETDDEDQRQSGDGNGGQDEDEEDGVTRAEKASKRARTGDGAAPSSKPGSIVGCKRKGPTTSSTSSPAVTSQPKRMARSLQEGIDISEAASAMVNDESVADAPSLLHPSSSSLSAPSSPSYSAMQRLRSVTFRHPDVELGCEDDSVEHDLFCRHHRRWRDEALLELTTMPRAAFMQQVQHYHDQFGSLRVTDPDAFYIGLLRRWGHRVRFVAPIQMEDEVTMQHGMSHLSLELHSHDVGCLFYSHDFLLQRSHELTVLPSFLPSAPDRPIIPNEAVARASSSSRSTTSPAPSPSLTSSSTDFRDADATLRSRDPRKYWVMASDHVRDGGHGNSDYLLDLYRLLTGDEATSFDAWSAVDERLPLEWVLELGCMLVVVVQTEGMVVWVPSAEANESAHLVSTGPDKAVVSVAGNLLSPRHVARLVRQHEEEGPTDEVKVEWVQDYRNKAVDEVSATERYDIRAHSSLEHGLSMQVPTAALIERAHDFLSSVPAHDSRYRVDYHRQSWATDLFFSSQACKLVSEYLHHHPLPQSVVEQLVGMGYSADTRAMAAALISQSAVASAGSSSRSTGSSSSSVTTSNAAWHGCRAELGCPKAVAPLLTLSRSSPFQQLQSIRRPPVLLLTPEESRQTQVAITGLVHQAIAGELIHCNSFTSPLPGPGAHAVKAEYWSWTKRGQPALTLAYVDEVLTEHRTLYLTDIVTRTNKQSAALWKEQADELVARVLGQHTTSGFLLRHCSQPTPGVHTPSYFALFSHPAAQDSALAQSSPHHNESHHCAAWHLLLRHPKQAEKVDLSDPLAAPKPAADESTTVVVQPSIDDGRVSASDISIIFYALASKSDIHEGSSILRDGITATSVRGRGSSPSLTPAQRYSSSVSSTFGQLTLDGAEKVIEALQITSSTPLLDIGSAFGRFCIQTALATGADVTGIEAIDSVAQHAKLCFDELCVEYPHIMINARSKVRLVHGNILAHLPELFRHRRVLVFDKCFAEVTRSILAYLYSYLAGVDDLRVVSCQLLRTRNPDLVQVQDNNNNKELKLKMARSGGSEFTARVFKVDQRAKRRHLVEVFLSDVHGMGVRAVRAIPQGHTIMPVHGEPLDDSTLASGQPVWRREVLPYLVHTPSADKPGNKAWVYAWGISRYINSCVNTGRRQNVRVFERPGESKALDVVATRRIAKGEELLDGYGLSWPNTGGDSSSSGSP